MKVIAITGGIASGKSTVKSIINKVGYKVIDSDELAHQILFEPDVIKKLVDNFGISIINEGIIERKRLGDIIFNDPKKLLITNEIIHPRVKALIRNALEIYKDEEMIFVDVPLLFEIKMEEDFQYVIVVYINEKLQLTRLMKRDNIEERYAKIKMSHQIPLSEKVKRADFIINNEGSRLQTENQVLDLLGRLKNEI